MRPAITSGIVTTSACRARAHSSTMYIVTPSLYGHIRACSADEGTVPQRTACRVEPAHEDIVAAHMRRLVGSRSRGKAVGGATAASEAERITFVYSFLAFVDGLSSTVCLMAALAHRALHWWLSQGSWLRIRQV
jgi:hypothetical protein